MGKNLLILLFLISYSYSGEFSLAAHWNFSSLNGDTIRDVSGKGKFALAKNVTLANNALTLSDTTFDRRLCRLRQELHVATGQCWSG